jgi:hypothetical protein
MVPAPCANTDVPTTGDLERGDYADATSRLVYHFDSPRVMRRNSMVKVEGDTTILTVIVKT